MSDTMELSAKQAGNKVRFEMKSNEDGKVYAFEVAAEHAVQLASQLIALAQKAAWHDAV